LFDFVSWFRFKFSEWRWLEKEGGITTYSWLLLIPLFLILARKLYFKKRIKRLTTDREKKNIVTFYPGIESEFYRIEKRLNEFGFNRYHWETLSNWLKRIKESHPIDVPTGSIDSILALHYRYRFDPRGITTDEKTLLKSNVQSWLEQSEGISKANLNVT